MAPVLTPRAPLVALAAVLAPLLAGCDRGPERPSVLLVTVDTLRADRLGCYGYERPTSPELDALAEEAVLFERAYSHAPFTAPSHASLFTSLHPRSHGVLSWGMEIAPEARTFAERFRDAGWRTGAFYNHPTLAASAIERGFEHVEKRYFEPAEDTLEGFLAWVDAEDEAPFAAWVHLWDVHRPYGYRDWSPVAEHVDEFDPRPPFAFAEDAFGAHPDRRVGRLEAHYNLDERERERLAGQGWSEREWEYIEDRYDGGVRYADAALGALLDGLEARGLLDETIVVVTSDHGEAFTERGGCWFTHDPYVTEETLRVPLLVRLPGGARGGTRVDALARGIDVLPTLLDLADLPGTGTRGRSLVPAMEGRAPEGPTYLLAETQSRHPKEADAAPADAEGWFEHRVAISDGELRLVIDRNTGATALYDLARDPGERVDVADDPAYADARARLERALQAHLALPPAGAGAAELDPEERAILEALGYVGKDS